MKNVIIPIGVFCLILAGCSTQQSQPQQSVLPATKRVAVTYSGLSIASVDGIQVSPNQEGLESVIDIWSSDPYCVPEAVPTTDFIKQRTCQCDLEQVIFVASWWFETTGKIARNCDFVVKNGRVFEEILSELGLKEISGFDFGYYAEEFREYLPLTDLKKLPNRLKNTVPKNRDEELDTPSLSVEILPASNYVNYRYFSVKIYWSFDCWVYSECTKKQILSKMYDLQEKKFIETNKTHFNFPRKNSLVKLEPIIHELRRNWNSYLYFWKSDDEPGIYNVYLRVKKEIRKDLNPSFATLSPFHYVVNTMQLWNNICENDCGNRGTVRFLWNTWYVQVEDWDMLITGDIVNNQFFDSFRLEISYCFDPGRYFCIPPDADPKVVTAKEQEVLKEIQKRTWNEEFLK